MQDTCHVLVFQNFRYHTRRKRLGRVLISLRYTVHLVVSEWRSKDEILRNQLITPHVVITREHINVPKRDEFGLICVSPDLAMAKEVFTIL